MLGCILFIDEPFRFFWVFAFLLLLLLFMRALFSAIKFLPWVIFWVYYASLIRKNNLDFLFLYGIKAGFLLVISVKFQLSGNLKFPQCMFYLKTKTSCVLKHF